MRSTSIKEIKKTADMEPVWLRRKYKIITRFEKLKPLPGYPLHKHFKRE